jgi:hypothetical protein
MKAEEEKVVRLIEEYKSKAEVYFPPPRPPVVVKLRFGAVKLSRCAWLLITVFSWLLITIMHVRIYPAIVNPCK